MVDRKVTDPEISDHWEMYREVLPAAVVVVVDGVVVWVVTVERLPVDMHSRVR